MAIEKKRGCGYRKVGGLYLCGGGIPTTCDRLPLPLEPCPVCAERPRFTRSIERIVPRRLWGSHGATCSCPTGDNCPVCWPPGDGWLMWVGESYTPESFIREALDMGISKRIPALPVEMKLHQDWVYLAYAKLLPKKGKDMLLPFGGEESRRYGFKPGVFYVFRAQRLELIVTETQAQDEEAMKELKRKNIHPVAVPDDDPDHKAQQRGKDDDGAGS